MSMLNLPAMPKNLKLKTCPAGSKSKEVFKYEYDQKYGCPRRVKNGSIDIDEYIQQSKDSVDFAAMGKMLLNTKDNVIDHFSINGEVFDQTALPRNIHEYEALHNKMKTSFEGLTPDIKAIFGNDFAVFAKVYQSGNIKKALAGAFKKPEEKQVPPVEE